LGFSPTVYVDVSAHMEAKLSALNAHESQVLKNGLVDLEAVQAQARYRGFQARIKVAEAFEVERFLWDVSPPPPLAHSRSGVVAKSFEEAKR
jgi:LmbE family N-acetylglucosaminyl deacetylase